MQMVKGVHQGILRESIFASENISVGGVLCSIAIMRVESEVGEAEAGEVELFKVLGECWFVLEEATGD